MHKTAAVRSQTRRATLAKVAQALPFNPAQALGYAGMLGGGALVGDAAMNGEQSTLKRVGKGVLGAGLAYAGHKALTDPTAQDIIRTGTQRAMDYIRRFLRKTAEARVEKRALDNVGSEIGGTMAAPLIGGVGGSAAGAIIGAALAAARGRRIAHGAGTGAAVGLTLGVSAAQLANLGGVLTGVIRKRRTKKEQQEHDSKSHWENLIPGVGSYNYTKRMGRVLAGVGEPDEQKKTAEAAYAEGFCKAAEVAGVDPVALYKQAAPWAAIGKMVGRGMRMARSAQRAVQPVVSHAVQVAPTRARNAMQSMRSAGRRYMDLMRGDTLAKWQGMEQNLGNLAARHSLRAGSALTSGQAVRLNQIALRALAQASRAGGLAAKERHAVDTARFGTLGAAGLLGLAARRRKPEVQPGTQPQGLTPVVRDPLGSDFANLGALYGR